MKNIGIRFYAWLIGLTTAMLAIAAWGQNIGWDFTGVSLYDIFPLLGLIAFGLMWSHYITGSLQRLGGYGHQELSRYFTYTSLVVLFFIVLHPLIFYIALFLDGFGIPPLSSFDVYEDSISRIALVLGILSLGVFLLFELHRLFSKAAWWRYVEAANVVAMFAIFYHGLQLGGELMDGWYRAVWIGYGVLLIAAVAYNYWYDHFYNKGAPDE